MPLSLTKKVNIYWSKGMTKAWEEIKKDSRVKISIDLYYFGIVFDSVRKF